jgi:aspartate/methionine/tyrosine aminotransferase
MRGLQALRRAVAEHDQRFYGLELDPEREVLVTSGATEALADCFLALLNPGDEAIVFEPVYDSYKPMIERAGAKAVPVRLEPPAFQLPRKALADAFSPRTKLVVVNSPMNPCSKVFDTDELSYIAELCLRHDVYALCDEVYEHLVFDGRKHVPLMTLPGMRPRTARIGSAGKTFSFTGWKIGYVSADAALLEVIAKTHQFVTFTSPPALQLAVADGLREPDSYFAELARTLEGKRDFLASGLHRLGFEVLPCQGTYFLSLGYADLGFNLPAGALCRRLTVEAGVASIPLDAFYGDGEERPYLRLCFAKRPEVLTEALARLARFLGAPHSG